jgi:phage terminase large subunit-like protein
MVEECAAFPNGAHDDQVDSAVMAWMRFRQGNFIALADDDNEEPELATDRYEYYG